MEQLKDYTVIQLTKFMNDAKSDHEEKKVEIRNILDENKEIIEKYRLVEEMLNKEMDNLDRIEQRYIKVIEELNSRGK